MHTIENKKLLIYFPVLKGCICIFYGEIIKIILSIYWMGEYTIKFLWDSHNFINSIINLLDLQKKMIER